MTTNAPATRHPLRSPGFTLIEVLVALAIVAVSFIAMFSGISQVVESAIVMQDRTLASWVAYDRITELRLAGEFPEAGSRSSGEIDMAEITWRYEVEYRQGGASEIIRQVIVRVSNAEEPELVLAEATGVLVNQGAGGAVAGGPNWGDSGGQLIPAPDPNAPPQELTQPQDNTQQNGTGQLDNALDDDGNPFE